MIELEVLKAEEVSAWDICGDRNTQVSVMQHIADLGDKREVRKRGIE